MQKNWRIGIAYFLAWVMAFNAPAFLYGAGYQGAPAGGAIPAGPIFVVPTITTPDELIDIWEDLFETLFAKPFDPNQWTYPLETPVDQEGVFAGVNHLGQSFELEVLVFAPTPLDTLGLTPRQIQALEAANFTISAVIGQLSTDLATVPVSGSVISTEDATHPLDVRFAVGELLDPSNPLFSPPPLPVTSPGDGAGLFPLDILCFPIPLFCSDLDCAEDCTAAYNAAVAAAEAAKAAAESAANAAFDLAQSLADIQRNGEIASAHNTYAGEVANAKSAMGIGLAACAITLNVAITYCALASVFTWYTFGLATAACIATAYIVSAGCTATVMTVFAVDMAQASNNLSTNVNAANINYNTAMAAAAAIRNSALATANAAFESARAAAQAALDACLQDCIYICGWMWICIYLV
ncbi:MAG: hypothetical protein ACKVX7_19405 [Planctomycetota bacterium]